jgi:hypothetical protein
MVKSSGKSAADDEISATLLFLFSAQPWPRIVQQVVFHEVKHAIPAQVNKHHARNFPDDQQSFPWVFANKAVFRGIFPVKEIIFFIVIGKRHNGYQVPNFWLKTKRIRKIFSFLSLPLALFVFNNKIMIWLSAA